MAEVVISESSVSRLAGNIASGLVDSVDVYELDNSDGSEQDYLENVSRLAVKLARMIVNEVKRTA